MIMVFVHSRCARIVHPQSCKNKRLRVQLHPVVPASLESTSSFYAFMKKIARSLKSYFSV